VGSPSKPRMRRANKPKKRAGLGEQSPPQREVPIQPSRDKGGSYTRKLEKKKLPGTSTSQQGNVNSSQTRNGIIKENVLGSSRTEKREKSFLGLEGKGEKREGGGNFRRLQSIRTSQNDNGPRLWGVGGKKRSESFSNKKRKRIVLVLGGHSSGKKKKGIR